MDGWDLPTAQVVCRELGCATALRAFNVSGRANETVRIGLSCPEKEKPLGECERLDTKKCGHSEDAAVECSGKMFFIISQHLGGPEFLRGGFCVYLFFFFSSELSVTSTEMVCPGNLFAVTYVLNTSPV